MSNEIQQWMIKEGGGRIAGPFTTERVLELISNLILTGDEMISSYPNGEWIPISRHPDFYDRLLDIISNTQRGGSSGEEAPEVVPSIKEDFKENVEQKKSAADVEATAIGQEPPTDSKILFESEKNKVNQDKTQTKKRTKAQDVIELTDIKAHIKKQKRKKARTPLFVSAAVLLAAIVALLTYEPPKDKLRLILPRKNRPAISSVDGQKRFEAAVSEFSKDTFLSYNKAMNLLVPAAEGLPKSGAIWQMLCLTYRELWPFTYQDQKDYEVIDQVVQMAEGGDPGGVYSATCRVVRALVNGKSSEAKTQVETAIEKAPTSAVLYELKGSIYGGGVDSVVDADFATGLEYMNKSIQLWPQWLKPRVLASAYYRKYGDPGQAITLLKQVLDANPQHDIARAIYGGIQFKELNKQDIALSQLLPIAESKQIPRVLLSEVNITLATIFSQRGEFNRASKHAKIAFRLNPTSKEARELARKFGSADDKGSEMAMAGALYIGDQYFAKGDYIAAQAEYRVAFEANPKNGMAALKAAKSFWKIGQALEAMAWIDKAIKASPTLIEAYVTKAEYYTERFDFLSAGAMLSKALAINKMDFEIYRGYANMELKRNNPAGAISGVETALKINPTDVGSTVILAKAYLQQKNISEAYRVAAKAIELENGAYETQDIYAKTLAQVQGFETANVYVKQLINTFPKIYSYRLILADLYFQDEKYLEAEAVYRQYTQLEPNKKEGYWGLGKCLQAQGKFKEAANPLLTGASKDLGDATSWFLLGQLYAAAGQFQKAISAFETVITKNPIFPQAHLSLGRVAQQTGNWDLALSEALKEQVNNPGSAEAYLLAAEVYSQQQRYTQCTGEIQKALKLNSQGAKIYIVLAKCYRLSGSIDTALSMIRIAEEKESGLADVYLELGLIYETKGSISEAVTAFNQYLVLAPNAKDAEQVKQKINSLGGGR